MSRIRPASRLPGWCAVCVCVCRDEPIDDVAERKETVGYDENTTATVNATCACTRVTRRNAGKSSREKTDVLTDDTDVAFVVVVVPELIPDKTKSWAPD